MAGYKSRKSADQDESNKVLTGPMHNPELRCRADGCRLAWSVETGEQSRLCSYHAWEKPEDWPSITDGLLRSGPWLLRNEGESDGVRDMKTRLRGKLNAPDLGAA